MYFMTSWNISTACLEASGRSWTSEALMGCAAKERSCDTLTCSSFFERKMLVPFTSICVRNLLVSTDALSTRGFDQKTHHRTRTAAHAAHTAHTAQVRRRAHPAAAVWTSGTAAASDSGPRATLRRLDLAMRVVR